MENAIENLIDLTTVINSFRGEKTRKIAELLFKKEQEIEDYLINFAGRGFNSTDDLFTYRSHRIVIEDVSFLDFDIRFLNFGMCNAVSECFYQHFEEEEAIIVNTLFSDSNLSSLNVFEGIKSNNDLSIYKFIL